MKILLMGVGMQGKAALHDLANCKQVTEIIAADQDRERLQALVAAAGYDASIKCRSLDAADMAAIEHLMAEKPDVAIDLLPPEFIDNVAEAALKHGVHLVNTFYIIPSVEQLADRAKAAEVTILPEFGMDPGIDLVLLGEAVRSLDKINEIVTYGSGIPAPEAADNPLRYKVSWTFEGVLNSYNQPASIIRDGRAVRIEAAEIFDPGSIHEIEIGELGQLEAFPNEDATRYANLLGLKVEQLTHLGRYTLRWPGHAAFWRTLARLHLLDDEPVVMDGHLVDKKRFLASVLEPQLRYAPGEVDLGILRIDVKGVKGDKTRRIVYEVIDRRDPQTGFSAMSRLVGFTASIGAQLIAGGIISKRGVLSPANDFPYMILKEELGKRGISITSEVID